MRVRIKYLWYGSYLIRFLNFPLFYYKERMYYIWHIFKIFWDKTLNKNKVVVRILHLWNRNNSSFDIDRAFVWFESEYENINRDVIVISEWDINIIYIPSGGWNPGEGGGRRRHRRPAHPLDPIHPPAPPPCRLGADGAGCGLGLGGAAWGLGGWGGSGRAPAGSTPGPATPHRNPLAGRRGVWPFGQAPGGCDRRRRGTRPRLNGPFDHLAPGDVAGAPAGRRELWWAAAAAAAAGAACAARQGGPPPPPLLLRADGSQRRRRRAGRAELEETWPGEIGRPAAHHRAGGTLSRGSRRHEPASRRPRPRQGSAGSPLALTHSESSLSVLSLSGESLSPGPRQGSPGRRRV